MSTWNRSVGDGINTFRAMNVQIISEGWQFKQKDAEEWLSVARVPTNVHLDLMDNDIIDDPFLGYNELQCEWVAEKSWSYRVTFAAPSVLNSKDGDRLKVVLAFDGLDTYATVKLNGKIILESTNMWITHRLDITNEVSTGGNHLLEIDFKSALLESRKIKDALPDHKWVGSNGDMARLAVRKAQYHFGWDWGPVLTTCGPWRAVRLETYQARIKHLKIDYEFESDFTGISGSIIAAVEGRAGSSVCFRAELDGVEVFVATSHVDADGQARVEFHINEPKLWYPHGYGKQTLYVVTATLTNRDRELHSLSKRTGFRKCELVQVPDHIGKSFYFRLNGVDIFCGGSNWIPADTFIPRITEAKYRKWLQTLVDGNQVMLRVWGGGIWEEDVFYDLCDELGMLVWQDFMFACGNYPAYPEFLKSVQEECVCQTKRLRHHPSLAVYAGNNEDYQIQEQMGLKYDYEDKDPQSWLKTDFPARFIYEKLLPDVVATHSPQIPYHPGSPWGDGKATSNPTVGDMHQWNVWHGTQEKYQIFDSLGGRFNSEFGMEAFPHIETIKYFVTDALQLYPQSQMIDFHNKAAGHERRIATYVVENFRMETELEKFIHLTQLAQAEALTFGYRGWRRQWGQNRHCGGALVWQLNDCWPVTSWAIVDYFLRKKPAYYALRRVLAPIAVAVRRAHHDWSVVHARPAKTSEYECWVASSLTKSIVADVELRYISIATGHEIKESVTRRDVEIDANGTTEIFKGTIDNTREEPHVLAARILIEGEIVSRDIDWPQPLKYLDFSGRGVEVVQDANEIRLSVTKPTKGLALEERDDVLLSDSAVDVVPGDEQVIKVSGLRRNDRALKWTYLGKP